MRQVFQELSTGVTTVGEVPAPGVPHGGLLIATRRSLISAGTERSVVEFSRRGWVEARARAFVTAIRAGTTAPIPMDELLEVARVTVTLGEQAWC